jgi:hypothetical protein
MALSPLEATKYKSLGFASLPADVVLYILDYYVLPFHRYTWRLDQDNTKQSYAIVLDIFFGWFRNDSFRQPKLIFRNVSMKSYSRFGYLTSNGTLAHTSLAFIVQKLLPRTITNLDLSDARYRVSYNRFHHLRTLNLKNALPLSSDVTSLLSHNKSLTDLDLRECNIRIGKYIDKFSQVRHLNMRRSAILAADAQAILDNLKSLESLNIFSRTKLPCVLFSKVSEYEKLEKVELPIIHFSDSMDRITFAKSLRSLHVRANHFTWTPYVENHWLTSIKINAHHIDPDSLKAVLSYTGLEELGLSFSYPHDCTDDEAELLSNLPLKTLSLTGFEVHQALGGSTLSQTLKTLDSHHAISSTSLAGLISTARLSSLTLSFAEMEITRELLALIQVIANSTIRTLHVRNNILTDDCAAVLAKSPTLETLDISFNHLSHDGIIELAKSQSLTDLSVLSVFINEDALTQLFSNKYLESLAVHYDHITHDHVQMIKQSTNLTKLVLARSDNIENEVVRIIVRECDNILDLGIILCD